MSDSLAAETPLGKASIGYEETSRVNVAGSLHMHVSQPMIATGPRVGDTYEPLSKSYSFQHMIQEAKVFKPITACGTDAIRPYLIVPQIYSRAVDIQKILIDREARECIISHGT